MPTLEDIRDNISLITFDCYGTLIDWEAGMGQVLDPFARKGGHDLQDLIGACIRHEASIQTQGYRTYREVQAATLRTLSAAYNFALPDAAALSAALPDWTPFPDTDDALRRLKSRYRLGVLSNIDRDLFAATARHFSVEFDLVVTAQDVHGYKPSHAHFIRALQQSRLPAGQILHAAESLYHDGRPAHQLGFNFVWINRYGRPAQASCPMLARLPNLHALADALGL